MDDTVVNFLNLPDTHLKSKLTLLHVFENRQNVASRYASVSSMLQSAA